MNRHERGNDVNWRVRGGLTGLLLLAGLWATPCPAEDWARKMFKTTSHDFGMIAAGAKAEYKFVFKNHLVSDVHVARASSSCGCASVRIENDSLKTYEESAIIANVNSKSLRGRQRSTITVVFDRPYYRQVQLNIKVYIRGDVVVEPASLVFGDVDLGVAEEKTVTVTHYGDPNWRILDAKGSADYLSASLSEPEQSGNRVSYDLEATVSEKAPAGYMEEDVVLTTTEGDDEQIRVMVQGRVVPEIRVGPATLFFGTLAPREEVIKRLVVSGKKPFRISSVEADCACLQIEVPEDGEPKRLHLIPVKFTARNDPGALAQRIYISTDYGEQNASVVVYANVKAPSE